jgi:hypothetical protein
MTDAQLCKEEKGGPGETTESRERIKSVREVC